MLIHMKAVSILSSAILLTMSQLCLASGSHSESDVGQTSQLVSMPAQTAAERVKARDNFGDITDELTWQNRRRTYIVHVPPGYKSVQPAPLIIMLHGGAADATMMRRISGMNKYADQSGIIVAYPNGTGRLKSKLLTWNAGGCCGYSIGRKVDDISFLRQLIAKLRQEYAIDPSRIYLAGYSNGAMLALLAASRMSEIAAVASVAGSMTGKEPKPNGAVSVLMIHGRRDHHVPYKGGRGLFAFLGYPVNEQSVEKTVKFWALANRCQTTPEVRTDGKVLIERYKNGREGAEVVLFSMSDGHHSWPGGKKSRIYSRTPFRWLSASQKITEFFLEHPKESFQLATDPLEQPQRQKP